MAKETTTAEEWTTVDEGSPTLVSFEVGDVLIAVYTGPKTIVDPNTQKEWTQHLFVIPDPNPLNNELAANELVGVNETYALAEPMSKVPVGALTRLECTKEIPTKKGNPMKSMKVQYKSA